MRFGVKGWLEFPFADDVRHRQSVLNNISNTLRKKIDGYLDNAGHKGTKLTLDESRNRLVFEKLATLLDTQQTEALEHFLDSYESGNAARDEIQALYEAIRWR